MRIISIKNSADFQSINKSGEKFFAKTIILLSSRKQSSETKKSIKNFCRLGLTVSKTVSKSAVKRNLAKRRLREAFRNLGPIYAKDSYDYVIIARKEIATSDFTKILSDLKFCLSRIHKPQTRTNKTSLK